MPNPSQSPAAAEVQVLDQAAYPQVAEAARQIARRLRQRGLTVLGLLPCNDEAAVLPAAAQIASALAEQCGAPVALVDVNARWAPLPQVAVSEPAAGPAGVLLTRWLGGDKVALLSLPSRATIGVGLVELGRILRSSRTMFEHLLIDLTGLDRLGEHLSAAAMCDALVLCARSGATTEDDLQRTQEAFAGKLILGVLLLSAKT